MRGVVLYGPPAAGKDTITRALVAAARRFQRFEVLKAGPGNRTGYVMTTPDDIDRRPHLLWDVSRYGARYAVDRDDLARAAETTWPVVHCGSPAAVDAITGAGLGEWLTVALWCPRSIAENRLRERDPLTVTERLRVWDRTPRLSLTLNLDTSTIQPAQAASTIASRFDSLASKT